MAGGIFAKELEDELMKYTVKQDCLVESKSVEKIDEVQTNGELEVNITECTKPLCNELITSELQNTTESSSSFGDSSSETENEDSLGDSEASSQFHGNATSALDVDEFGRRLRMRKKKVTTHWRSFIQPLMWRCKWVELQIHRLQTKGQQYDRKLESFNHQKQAQGDDTTVDGVKSLPFVRGNAKNAIFKRKKRRRMEATEDLTQYMSQHNLFSCYENKKLLTEGAFANNESKNTGVQTIKIDDDMWEKNDLLLSFESDDDNSVESILHKITSLQSHLGDLQTKFDKIMRENAERLSYAETLNLSPQDNKIKTEGTCISSQATSSTNHLDFPSPNRTVGRTRPRAYKNAEERVLSGNKRIKKEVENFEEVKIQPTTHSVLSESDVLTEDQSPPKIRSIAKLTAPVTKKKSGRKKASTSRRARRRTSG